MKITSKIVILLILISLGLIAFCYTQTLYSTKPQIKTDQNSVTKTPEDVGVISRWFLSNSVEDREAFTTCSGTLYVESGDKILDLLLRDSIDTMYATDTPNLWDVPELRIGVNLASLPAVLAETLNTHRKGFPEYEKILIKRLPDTTDPCKKWQIVGTTSIPITEERSILGSYLGVQATSTEVLAHYGKWENHTKGTNPFSCDAIVIDPKEAPSVIANQSQHPFSKDYGIYVPVDVYDVGTSTLERIKKSTKSNPILVTITERPGREIRKDFDPDYWFCIQHGYDISLKK